MRLTDLNKLWFFNRGRMFAPPTDQTSASAEPVAVSQEGLEHLPGGEMLAGATTIPVKDESKLPSVWTPENATGEPEEEPAPAEIAADVKPAEGTETATLAEGPTAEEIAALPEPIRAHVEKLSAEKGEAAKQLETANAEKATLTAQLAEARSGAPTAAPPGANPLFAVRDERALSAHLSLAEAIIEWGNDHATTGGEMPAALQAAMQGTKAEEITEPTIFTAEQAKGFRAQAKAMLQAVPAQRAYLAEESAAHDFLKTNHPQFLDPNTEEGKTYAAFSTQIPWMRSFGKWPVAVADTVRGFLARTADEKAKAEKAGGKTTEPPLAPALPSVTRPGGTPTVTKPAAKSPALKASMTADELAATR